MANISAIKLPDGVTYNIKDNSSGYITGMTILSYGSSTWDDFITAYNANKVVYCRASSNSNPASGSQTRLAFMAYVNNATTPTNVEFQYYRSVSSHTASQQGDQVYVYKLDKTSGWSVTTREASVKVVAGTGLGGTYSNGTMTLTGPTKVSDLTNDSGFITGYTETDPIFTASAAHGITSSDITNWNGKQAALVSGTNIKTINGNSILGSGNMVITSGVSDVKSDGISVVTNGVANINTFTGATYSADGNKGLVPVPPQIPSVTGNRKYLLSDGTWGDFDLRIPGSGGASLITDWDYDEDDGENVYYLKVASTSYAGLMSSTDKSKLDGIESGAEVNYVTKITQHFIADPNDPQYVYPRSATLDYNAVGINDVELLTKTALGKFNGVCDLDASSKVPKSRLPSTSIPTADEVAEFDSDAQMNSTDMSSQDVDDFIDDLSIVGSLIDLFYPVGSYYETSDITFNPNTEWGGTWELETEGQVHIGAGTTYTIDGALTNSTDGGEEEHKLTTTESYYPARISTSLTISSTPVPQSGTARYAPTVPNANKWTKYDAHTASAHNNMQPYIIVNRWHRTA